MEDDEFYRLPQSILFTDLAEVKAQNHVILKILREKLLKESEVDDYLKYQDLMLRVFLRELYEQGQNPEGKYLAKISSEIEELENKLRLKGLIKPE